MSQPPEEPTDFETPDFLNRIPPSPPEGADFGIEMSSLDTQKSAEPPLAEAGTESTGSMEIPVEPSTPSMELAPEPSAPSVEIPEEQAETAEAEEEEVPAGPTFWQRLAEQLDRYTVILLLSLVAITVAVVLLALELSAYQWDIGAKAGR